MDQLRKAKRHCTMTSILLLCVVGVVRLTMGDSNVEFTLEEERNVGTVVGSLGDDRVLPLGLDATVRGSLGYNLLPVIARSNLFTVDERTGQIVSKARIDRETLCSTDKQCDLDIQVAVQSTVSQFFKKVKVTIKVQDINDNLPTFPRATTTLNILESATVGTNFALESASDLDIGVNGVRDYELAPNDGAFYVNLTRLDNDVTLPHPVIKAGIRLWPIGKGGEIEKGVDGWWRELASADHTVTTYELIMSHRHDVCYCMYNRRDGGCVVYCWSARDGGVKCVLLVGQRRWVRSVLLVGQRRWGEVCTAGRPETVGALCIAAGLPETVGVLCTAGRLETVGCVLMVGQRRWVCCLLLVGQRRWDVCTDGRPETVGPQNMRRGPDDPLNMPYPSAKPYEEMTPLNQGAM
ncbi:Protocadherin-10 [Bulinus truncatus]|nr:Protocadherin-10 [Bulinus truncatus]